MVPSGHAWWVATILDRTGLERGLLTSLWWCWGSRWPRLSSPLHPWCTSLRWGVGCTCRREKVVRPHVASHSRGSWGAGAWGGKGWWSSGQRNREETSWVESSWPGHRRASPTPSLTNPEWPNCCRSPTHEMIEASTQVSSLWLLFSTCLLLKQVS